MADGRRMMAEQGLKAEGGGLMSIYSRSIPHLTFYSEIPISSLILRSPYRWIGVARLSSNRSLIYFNQSII